jgi:hypothetical protein
VPYTTLEFTAGSLKNLNLFAIMSFDKISHPWLLSHIPMEKTILNKWLKAGYMDKSVLYPTEDGTPQGGIITLPTKLPTCW